MLRSFLDKHQGNNKALIKDDRTTQKPVAKYMDIGRTYQADIMEFKTDRNDFHYVLTFINTTNGKGDAYPLQSKSGANVYLATNEFLKKHKDVKHVQTDQGSEFISRQFRNLMNRSGIVHTTTHPGKKNQNAKIENYNYQLRSLINSLQNSKNSTTSWKPLVEKAKSHINAFRATNFKQRKIGEFFDDPIFPPKREELHNNDKVHVKLFKPQGMRFRAGDKRYENMSRTIENVLFRNGQTVKYRVSGINNSLFDRNELSKQK